MAGVRIFSKENKQMKTGVLGTSFQPTHIIYRKLALDTRGYHYIYAAKRHAIAHLPAQLNDINKFVLHLHNGGAIKWDQELKEEEDAQGVIRKLAIPAQVHAYVVVELDRSLPFTFDGDYPGVTFGAYEDNETEADSHYGDLMQCNPADGTLAAGEFEGCRIIVFSVIPRIPASKTSRQLLNFNVVDGYGTDATIDPDIRYPGTGGDVDGGGTP